MVTRSNLANSNVADVFNSIINMIGTGITIIVILLSPLLPVKFGKKAVAVSGFALGRLRAPWRSICSARQISGGMIALTVLRLGSFMRQPSR